MWTNVIIRVGSKNLNMKLNSYCTFIFHLHQCSNKVLSPVAVPVQCGQVVVFQIVCDGQLCQCMSTGANEDLLLLIEDTILVVALYLSLYSMASAH